MGALVLFGCQQCTHPAMSSDLGILATGVGAVLSFAVVLIAAWAQPRQP